jgi:ribosomal protein S12 methylthiotransferase
MNIHVISLGCSKNKVDTEQILGLLMDTYGDIVLVQHPRDADYTFVNTCGFLAEAREESFSILNELRNYPVILLGCLVPYVTKKIFGDYPNIRAVLRQGEYEQLPAILTRLQEEKTVFETASPLSRFDTTAQSRMLSSRFHAYLKIAEGCDNHCTYCLIPAIRGKYRSKPMEVIVQEATMLAKSGIKELILIAQDTSYYGLDRYKTRKLPQLLQRLCRIPGITWIRLHYTYPDRITPELINVMQKEKKIVPYLDIPFQHAHPDILRAMNRPNDIQKWKDMIISIRKNIPAICLRTTFIVGFPGETREHFETLKDFIQEIQFDRVSFFPYSREKGTPSYALPHQIREKVKQDRLQELMVLQQKISAKINQRFITTTVTVLIEGYDHKKQSYWGRSYRDSPDIDGKVYIKGKNLLPGTFVQATIQKANATDLWGTIDELL